MSGEIVEEQFSTVAEQVEETHNQSVADLKAKVTRAKTEALKKVSS